jgi:5,10-methylenetetrahydromethanopterin reductase
MRFTLDVPTSLFDEPAGAFVDLARWLEGAGVDRFAVADWRFFHDHTVVMTACLQATTRLELESLVTDPFVRHPALTAAAHATMDALSEGRVVLGFGAGVEQPTFWGYERPHPVAAVREAVEVCRRLFAGETVAFHGRVMHLDAAKLDFVPYRADLPILVAARGPRMLELAGEIADIVHLASYFMDLGHRRRELEHVYRGAARAGRPIDTVEIDLSVPCCVSDDREAARRAARRPAAQGILWMAAAERYSKERRDWIRPPEFDVPDAVVDALSRWDFWTHPELPAELAALIDDRILDRFSLAGTPEECAERLRSLQRELPEMTGVRLYTIAPPGKRCAEAYREMADPLARMIRLARDGSS